MFMFKAERSAIDRYLQLCCFSHTIFRALQLGLKGPNVEDLKAMKQSRKYIQMGKFVFDFNNLSQIAEAKI